MNFLVIGLGSMGQRRIRVLKKLNYKNIYGYDINHKRAVLIEKKYKITVKKKIKDALNLKIDFIIISTDPKYHMEYAYLANNKKIPCFIEASVTNVDRILKLSQLSKRNKTPVYPSCTMQFNDSILKIKDILNKNKIGKLYFIKYHVGQYLPDWHPWEDYRKFYVGNKKTNGCKELIPFELSWLSNLFGIPKFINGYKKKFSDLKIDFEDYYNFSLDFKKDIHLDMTIEILSRPVATRELKIIGSKGKIILSYDQKLLKYKNINMKNYKIFPFNSGKIVKGYINSETPYVNEVKTFLKAFKTNDQKIFPNNLNRDYKILKLTEKMIKKI